MPNLFTQLCTQSVAGVFERRLVVGKSHFKQGLGEPHISLGWLAVFRCHCCLVKSGWSQAISVHWIVRQSVGLWQSHAFKIGGAFVFCKYWFVAAIDFLLEVGQLSLILTVFRLKIFWNTWFSRNSLLKILRNVHPTFVATFLLKGGLY